MRSVAFLELSLVLSPPHPMSAIHNGQDHGSLLSTLPTIALPAVGAPLAVACATRQSQSPPAVELLNQYAGPLSASLAYVSCPQHKLLGFCAHADGSPVWALSAILLQS